MHLDTQAAIKIDDAYRNEQIDFKIPLRQEQQEQRQIDQALYGNKQYVTYTFTEDVSDISRMKFSIQGMPARFFSLLTKDELENIPNLPQSGLSVYILTEFIEFLKEDWADFLQNEMHVIRDHLVEYGGLDFEIALKKILEEKTSAIARGDPEYLESTYRHYEKEILLSCPDLKTYHSSLRVIPQAEIRVSRLLKFSFLEKFKNDPRKAKEKTLQALDEKIKWYSGLENENAKALADIMIFCKESELRKKMKEAFDRNAGEIQADAEKFSKQLTKFLDVTIEPGENLECDD